MDYDLGSLVLSAVAILITIWMTIWGKKSDQAKQNIQLIEQFFSSDFFKNVRSIVWEIDVKWFNLPDEKREAYRKEVVLGWVGYLNGSSNDILNHEVANDRIDIDHHLDEVKIDYLTEHQALSMYIGFWIKLYTYYETGEISKHLGRGRHTTRHTEFYRIDDFYIADTPGFSSLDLTFIEKEDIQYLFKEFSKYECKFKPCNHIEEIQCGVKHAVEEQAILQSRYDDYKALFKEKETQKRKYIKEK